MTELTPAQKEVRRRLRDDFKLWAAKCYTIIDKSGSLVKLRLNKAQLYLLDKMAEMQASGLPVRIIILKGRQQGMSTLIEAWQLWRTSQNKAKNAFVLAHVADSSTALFEQAKRGYDNLPKIVQPMKKRSNKKELIFGTLDSSLRVSTARGKAIGRGFMFQYVHASEVAFWEDSSAEENWNGLTQCVPNDPDSAIFAESTANGMGGLFHRLWTDAERGINGFAPVFLPWFWQPEYRKKVSGFKRSAEEDFVGNQFGLDDEQLAWRRDKIGTVGEDLFNQEYPNTPQDAFLTSGRPVFNQQTVYKCIQEAPEPKRRMGMVEGLFEEDDRGELCLWEEPELHGTYYIGADVAEGVKDGDYSVAQILDGKRNQVGVWRGHIHPHDFAFVLNELGRMFNDAIICIEMNGHGILPANVLAKDLNYPNIWSDQIYDRFTEEHTVRMGFTQNPKTRTMILNKLRQEVADWSIKINDETTLKEMLSFIVSENGKMEAETGAHDDHVMALAIANHINEGEWTPIAHQPEWYSEAL